MSFNRKDNKPTYTYAPKIVTNNPDSESAIMLEELLKSKMPEATDHPGINVIIDTDFVVKSPDIKIECNDASKQSTASIKERLNNESPDIIYSPAVYCTPDNVEEASRQFEELHKNRPKPGDNKFTVVSHSFNFTGKKMTLSDLLKERTGTTQASNGTSVDAANDDTTGIKLTYK